MQLTLIVVLVLVCYVHCKTWQLFLAFLRLLLVFFFFFLSYPCNDDVVLPPLPSSPLLTLICNRVYIYFLFSSSLLNLFDFLHLPSLFSVSCGEIITLLLLVCVCVSVSCAIWWYLLSLFVTYVNSSQAPWRFVCTQKSICYPVLSLTCVLLVSNWHLDLNNKEFFFLVSSCFWFVFSWIHGLNWNFI